MRKFIDLFEMPQLLSQRAYRGGFDDDGEEELDLLYRQFMRHDHEVLEQNSRYLLGRTRFDDAGEYFLISQPGNRVTYYNSYEIDVIPGIGRTATQKDVWANNPNYRSVARHVLLTYMLKDFDAVVSDIEQTPKGRDFWIRAMIEAINQGLTVGILNEHAHDIKVFDPNEPTPFPTWVQQNNPWGADTAFSGYRPFISRHTHL